MTEISMYTPPFDTLYSQAADTTHDNSHNAVFEIQFRAEQGSPQAQHILARFHRKGHPYVPRDVPRAIQLFKSSAAAGFIHGFRALATLYREGVRSELPKNTQMAITYYEQGVNKGDVFCMVRLAQILLKGDSDEQLQPDISRACNLLLRAIEQENDSEAKELLDEIIANNRVPHDVLERAERLYRQSCVPASVAEHSNAANSNYMLGRLQLSNGEQNLPEATEYFSAAVKYDPRHEHAQFHLAAILHTGGTNVASDISRASDLVKILTRLLQTDMGRMLETFLHPFLRPRGRKLLEDLSKKGVKFHNHPPAIHGPGLELAQRRRKESMFRRVKKTEYDIFISHAGPQKKDVAMPLKRHLEANGLICFLDETDIRKLHKPSKEQIENAMDKSQAGCFILTANFAARYWPMLELETFLKHAKRRHVKILPLFYGLTWEDCKNPERVFSGRHDDVITSEGFYKKSDFQVETVKDLLREVSGFPGIRNDRSLIGEDFAKQAADELLKDLRKPLKL